MLLSKRQSENDEKKITSTPLSQQAKRKKKAERSYKVSKSEVKTILDIVASLYGCVIRFNTRVEFLSSYVKPIFPLRQIKNIVKEQTLCYFLDATHWGKRTTLHCMAKKRM